MDFIRLKDIHNLLVLHYFQLIFLFFFYNIKYEINFLNELYILLCLSLISYLIGQIYGQSFFDLTSEKKK